MHSPAQKLLSQYYPESPIVKSVSELLVFKASNIITIFGNGPSALDLLLKYIYNSHRHDISGTSVLSLLKIPEITFYLTEPYFLLNEYIELNSQESLSNYSIHLLLTHEWICAASKATNIKCILPNPQFPSNQYGYIEAVRSPFLYVPDWTFINESSDALIDHGLDIYFMQPKKLMKILNFRGSIIRQISLSFILGYRTINLVGIDPSICSYWYISDPSSILGLLKDNYHERCSNLFAKMGQLLSTQSDPRQAFGSGLHHNTIGKYEFTRSIFVVVKKYLSHSDFSSTYFCYRGSDTQVLEILLELNLLDHPRFVLRGD